MYTETKKKSIAFIYQLLLTQNFGEMDSINCVHRKEKGIYRVFLIIVVDTKRILQL